MSSESPGDREAESQNSAPLPFEPIKSRKKQPKKPPTTSSVAAPKKEDKSPKVSTAQMAIPDVVSKRMVQRMAVLCGVPTFLGISTLIASYVVVSHNWLKLPNVVVIFLSMGFLGLGVLGLSYGLLSTSWDEEIPGSLIGWQEFTTNFGRMTSAWRSAGQKD